jgi:hypothetical protein
MLLSSCPTAGWLDTRRVWRGVWATILAAAMLLPAWAATDAGNATATAPAQPATDSGPHVFTNQQGKTIQAEILSVDGPTVTLKRADGQTFQVRIDVFSAADQAYIRSWVPPITGIAMWPIVAKNLLYPNGPQEIDYRSSPKLVDMPGVLRGKSLTKITSGGYNPHYMAVCADGTLVDFGNPNQPGYAQYLGITFDHPALYLPDELKGKQITSIVFGHEGLEVLCSDGVLYAVQFGRRPGFTPDPSLPAQGPNSPYRQLTSSTVVDTLAAQIEKKITAFVLDMAVCSDGTVYGWGDNNDGAMGTGSSGGDWDHVTRDQIHPEEVNTDVVLRGKTVTALATSGEHTLALCSDGTLAHWGMFPVSGVYIAGLLAEDRNLPQTVQTTKSEEDPEQDYFRINRVPVLVVDATGLLKGKTIVAIADGQEKFVALCSDGTLAAWGGKVRSGSQNNNAAMAQPPGETTVPMPAVAAPQKNIGPNAGTPIPVTPYPIQVSQAGVLESKTVTSVINAGDGGFLILCSDGTLGYWNGRGDPVSADPDGVLAGKTILSIAQGMALFKETAKATASTPP